MSTEFNLLLGVHLLSAGALIALLVLVLLSRQEPLALWLGGAFAALLVWNIAYMLELAAFELAAKLIWANMQFIGATLLPVFWLQAMLVATRARPLSRGLAACTYIAAAAVIACIYLDPGQLFRGQPRLDTASAIVFVDADYGPAYYFLWLPFAWGLLIATLGVLGRGCLHWDQQVKARSRLLLVATLVPMAGGALFISGLLPWPNYNPTVASLSLGSIFCTVALLRYRLLALTPLARDTVIEQFADGVIICDADGLLIDVNPAAIGIFPELGHERLGRPLTEVLWARPQMLHAYAALRTTSEKAERPGFEAGIVTVEAHDAAPSVSEAETRSYSLRLTRIRGRRERLVAEAIVLHDVTARMHLQRELQQIAATDGLTGLLSRREVSRRGDQVLAWCRQRGEPVAALLIDLDDFKPVNDKLGHAAGDAVLKAVARCCAEHVRACDLLARYGGDEICALLPGLAADDALIVAERFRAAVSGLSVWHGRTLVRTTVSVGVAVSAGEDGRTLEELISDADINLYRAKREGRDRIIASSAGEGEEAGKDPSSRVPAVASLLEPGLIDHIPD